MQEKCSVSKNNMYLPSQQHLTFFHSQYPYTMEFGTEEEDLRSVYGDDGRRSKYHVGGRTYTCHGDESNGFLWKALDAGGDESTAVRGCHVDSLAATARVIGTVRPPKGASEHCSGFSQPCLEDAEGTLHCVVGANSMPDVLNADWVCSDARPTKDSYTKSHEEFFGQSMETWILKPKPAAAITPVEEEAVEEEAVEEQVEVIADDPPPVMKELVVQEPEAMIGITVNNAMPEEKKEGERESPKEEDPSSWHQCDWFQGRTSQACEVDADCSLDKPFDVWFDATSELVKSDARTTVHTFLNAVADRATKVDFEWTASKPEVTSTDKVRRSTLRARLEKLHRTDETFRASVDKMLQEEMASTVTNAKTGACLATTKTCKRSLTVPTTSIFNGKQRVTFQRTATGKVTYTRDGEDITRDILSTSCDADDAPDACRDPSVEDVDNGNMAPVLGTSAPIRPSYRLHFTSADGATERLIVGNSIDAYGTIDATTRDTCAAQLCARNADECPAPHCQLDGASCIPNPVKTASVNLKPSTIHRS